MGNAQTPLKQVLHIDLRFQFHSGKAFQDVRKFAGVSGNGQDGGSASRDHGIGRESQGIALLLHSKGQGGCGFKGPLKCRISPVHREAAHIDHEQGLCL